MREFDHERKSGYLQAFREISRRAQIEDAAAWAAKPKPATVLTPDFTREMDRHLFTKRRRA